MFKLVFIPIILLFLINLIWYFKDKNTKNILRYINHTEILDYKNTSLKLSRITNDSIFDDYRKNDRIIFVVGFPGSGTTLMRTILDVSPNIYCGYETRFIPLVLNAKVQHLFEVLPDKEGSSYINIIDRAIRLMIIRIIEKDDPSYKILCVKDPRNVHYIEYLSDLFPNIKVIYLVRDGRGAVLSKMKRERKGKNKRTFYTLIKSWNEANLKAYNDCVKIGKTKCLMVKYENLVTYPEQIIRNITQFLEIEFIPEFLRHNFAKDVDFSLNYHNRNHREINKDSINTWDGVIQYNKSHLNRFNMFKILGYDI